LRIHELASLLVEQREEILKLGAEVKKLYPVQAHTRPGDDNAV
jgi:hypothetical protein